MTWKTVLFKIMLLHYRHFQMFKTIIVNSILKSIAIMFFQIMNILIFTQINKAFWAF